MQDDGLSWSNIAKLGLGLALVGVFVYVSYRTQDNPNFSYVSVAFIGFFVGLIEILGRYTDSPVAAIKSPGAFVYIAVNLIASVAALFVLTTTNLVPLGKTLSENLTGIMVAGFGSMAFMRSALFKVRVQEEEVAVGPAIILDTLLKFADAQVDRGRAIDRASRIATVVRTLTLAQASADLPRLCFALMQNVPVDLRQRVLDEVTLVVTDTRRSETVKVLEIGLVLWRVVGLGTLSGAVLLIEQMAGQPGAQKPTGAPPDSPAATLNASPPRPLPDLQVEIEQQLQQDRSS